MHIEHAVARAAMEVVMVMRCDRCGFVAGNLPWNADRADLARCFQHSQRSVHRTQADRADRAAGVPMNLRG